MPELTLADFQDTDLPFSEIVTGRMDHIHDCFLSLEYEIVDSLPRDGRDVVVLVDKVDRGARLERLGAYDGKVVLVAAPTDGPFGALYLSGRQTLPANFVAAFLTNNDLRDPRITNLPVGIRKENAHRFMSMRHDGAGQRDRLLYGNFNVNPAIYRPGADGEPHIRQRLAAQFEDAAWAGMDVAVGARWKDPALSRYYADMMRHKFVLSPPGLGADCYRHWEALYLGTIPIVTRSATTKSFAELPILFTEDYSEIDEPYLEEQWKRYSARRFEFRGLMKSFYRERFLQSVARLSNPRFLCWGFRGTDEEGFLEQLESVA